MTTTAETVQPVNPDAADRLPRGAAWSDAGVIATRNVKHLIRTPQLLIFSVVQTVMFLLLFVYVFGGSIHIPHLTFVEFLIPGYLAQIAIFDGFGVAVFFAEDSKSGLIERFRALPMARSAIVGGRAIADLLRQAVLLAIVTIVGFIVGFGFHGSIGGIVLAYFLALLWGFAMFWVFAAIGLFVRDAESAQAASTPFFIMVFVSSSIILVDTLPGWLQPIARNQPLTQVCNAMRGLMQGDAGSSIVEHSTGHYILTSVIWCVGIIAVFAPLAIRAYRRP
jgi:ABC-2 type transport system permease protein/oleandomycin transport system permease protein